MKSFRITALENKVFPAMNSEYILDEDFALIKMKDVPNYPGVPRISDCGHLVLSKFPNLNHFPAWYWRRHRDNTLSFPKSPYPDTTISEAIVDCDEVYRMFRYRQREILSGVNYENIEDEISNIINDTLILSEMRNEEGKLEFYLINSKNDYHKAMNSYKTVQLKRKRYDDSQINEM